MNGSGCKVSSGSFRAWSETKNKMPDGRFLTSDKRHNNGERSGDKAESKNKARRLFCLPNKLAKPLWELLKL